MKRPRTRTCATEITMTGSPSEIGEAIVAARLSGRLIWRSPAERMPEGDPRIRVIFQLLPQP